MAEVICPYCGEEAEWVDNAEVYGKRFGKSYMMYVCRSCDARVGCHQNSRVPLGTMANKELRQWRQAAHYHFDALWKIDGMKRKQAYQVLSDHFGHRVHIGASDKDQCRAIIEFVKEYRNGREQRD